MRFLPRDERESRTQLQQERFELPKDRVLQILFEVAVGKPDEVEHIRVFEHHGRGHLTLVAQCLEFLSNQLLGFARQRRTFIQHGVDALAQGPYAPALDTAHLRVELALQRLFERQQLAEMRPAQLSPQRGDNRFVGEGLRELHHAVHVLLRKAAPVLGGQLSRQCGDNLLAILGTLLAQHFFAYSPAHAPVEHRQGHVDRRDCRALRLTDELAQLVEDGGALRRRGGERGIARTFLARGHGSAHQGQGMKRRPQAVSQRALSLRAVCTGQAKATRLRSASPKMRFGV